KGNQIRRTARENGGIEPDVSKRSRRRGEGHPRVRRPGLFGEEVDVAAGCSGNTESLAESWVANSTTHESTEAHARCRRDLGAEAPLRVALRPRQLLARAERTRVHSRGIDTASADESAHEPRTFGKDRKT